MSFRLLPAIETLRIMREQIILDTDIPTYGLIAPDGVSAVLLFRKTDGQVLGIDVTGSVPAHFSQSYPVGETLWSELRDRVSAIVESVSRTVMSGTTFFLIGAVVGIVLWNKR